MVVHAQKDLLKMKEDLHRLVLGQLMDNHDQTTEEWQNEKKKTIMASLHPLSETPSGFSAVN